MTQRGLNYGSAATRTAEQQMRQWTLGLEIKDRVDHEQALKELPEGVHPFITISRDAGGEAEEIAHEVGRKLDWDVLGKELLDEMAEKFKLERGRIEFVDENRASWIVEVFGKWLDSRIVTPTEYVSRLGKIILLAAHHGSAVFLGRGAQFFLPRDRGLAVRIIAPRAKRIEHVRQRQQLDQKQAAKYVDDIDRDRGKFIQRCFHHDVGDAYLYDLVISLEHFTAEDAIHLIVDMYSRRFDLSPPIDASQRS